MKNFTVFLIFVLIAAIGFLTAADKTSPVTSNDIQTRSGRTTNTWDGSYNTHWHNSQNWSLNRVPLGTDDVIIPDGMVNYPVVDGYAECNSILAYGGTSLTIISDNLYVNTDAGLSCQLVLDWSGSRGVPLLDVANDLSFAAGSSVSITQTNAGVIAVGGDLSFLAGSNVNITEGWLMMCGTGHSNINTYAPTTLFGFHSSKIYPYSTIISDNSSSTLTIAENIWVESGSTLNHSYAGTTILKGNLKVDSGAYCNLDFGTLSLQGTGNSTLNLGDAGNHLNHLCINKTGTFNYTVYLASYLDARGDVTIADGVLSCKTQTLPYEWHPLYLGGNWTNNMGASGFIPGTVTLNGSGNQTLGSEDFATLVLDNSAGIVYIPSGSAVTCISFDWEEGAYAVTGGTFTANDLADDGIFGTIVITEAGVINYHQDAFQLVDLNADVTITHGTLNVYGGASNAIFSYAAPATLNIGYYGTLDYHDQGIIVSELYPFNFIVTGLGKIRTASHFIVSRNDFNPPEGIIELYGNTDCNLTSNTASNLHTVYINKSDISVTVTGGGFLDINGGFFLLNGTFIAPPVMKVARSWNNAGNAEFVEGTGRVIFDGADMAFVDGNETFNILELGKNDDTVQLRIKDGFNVTCNSYDRTSGWLYIEEGSFTALDLADNGIYGKITVLSGTINFHQDTTPGSFVDLNGNLSIGYLGTVNVFGGSDIAIMGYASPATLTMRGLGVLNYKDQGIRISPSYDFIEDINEAIIRTPGDFEVYRNDFQPSCLTLELNGNSDANLINTSGSFLNQVVINKSSGRDELQDLPTPEWHTDRDGNPVPITRSNTVTGSGPILINGNFEIQAGTFVAPDAMTVYGNWTNLPGPDAFVEGTGTVTIGGTCSSVMSTENFHILILEKYGLGDMQIHTGSTVTCNAYDWEAGPYWVNGGTFTVMDLLDPGIYGAIHLSSGTINYNQDMSSAIDMHVTLTIEQGTMNAWGGNNNSWWYGYLSMSGGTLDFHDAGIQIQPLDDGFDSAINGGTIRSSGDFLVYSHHFQPTSGKVELYGSADCETLHNTGSYFHELEINKASSRLEESEIRQTNRDDIPTSPTRNNTVTASSSIVVKSNFILTSGTFIAPGSMRLYGNWIQTGGAIFNPNNGTVTFGQLGGLQSVYGTCNFYNVTDSHTGDALTFQGQVTIEGTLQVDNLVTFHNTAILNSVLNNQSTGQLVFYDNHASTVSSYTGGGALRSLNTGNHVMVSDLVQNGIYGSYLSNGGHLEIHQDPEGWIDLNGSMEILNGGIVDIYGGTANMWFAYDAPCSLIMNSGEFNVRDWGITISETALESQFDISGGTIRCNGNWNDTRGNFDPTGGTVMLTGSGDNVLTSHASSWFRALFINKNTLGRDFEPDHETDRNGNRLPLTRSCNLTINACTVKNGITVNMANTVTLGGSLTSLEAGAITINAVTLDLNGHNLVSTGNIAVNGTLVLDEGAVIQMAGSKSITVNNGGRLEAIGTSTQPARFSHYLSGYYGFNIESGATLAASYVLFEYMNMLGVNVKNGALVEYHHSFDNCIFRYGIATGKLLTINNNQCFTVNNAGFPANTWMGMYNVSKTVDQGGVYFVGCTGAFAGPAFEQDTYNRIYWEGVQIPGIENINITYLPISGLIQLNWSYPWPISPQQFNIYRSNDSAGQFELIDSTTNLVWSEPLPGHCFFYKVTAGMP